MSKFFRQPRHRQLLAAYFAAKADRVLPFTVPEVIKEGSWSDIPRKPKNKQVWKSKRRKSKKIKENLLTN